MWQNNTAGNEKLRIEIVLLRQIIHIVLIFLSWEVFVEHSNVKKISLLIGILNWVAGIDGDLLQWGSVDDKLCDELDEGLGGWLRHVGGHEFYEEYHETGNL